MFEITFFFRLLIDSVQQIGRHYRKGICYYYNKGTSSGQGELVASTNGSNSGSYANTNGSVHGFVTSIPHCPLGLRPRSLGAALPPSVQSWLASLPEESSLRLHSAPQPFPLQPASTSRKEILSRRQFNNEMVVSYNRNADQREFEQIRKYGLDRRCRERRSRLQFAGLASQNRFETVGGRRQRQVGLSGRRFARRRRLHFPRRELGVVAFQLRALFTHGSNGTSGVWSMNDKGHSLTPPEPAAHPCPPFGLTAARRPVEAAGLYKQVLPPPHVAARVALFLFFSSSSLDFFFFLKKAPLSFTLFIGKN